MLRGFPAFQNSFHIQVNVSASKQVFPSKFLCTHSHCVSALRYLAEFKPLAAWHKCLGPDLQGCASYSIQIDCSNKYKQISKISKIFESWASLKNDHACRGSNYQLVSSPLCINTTSSQSALENDSIHYHRNTEIVTCLTISSLDHFPLRAA